MISQGMAQGIVSFFSGKATVADIAQQAGVTLPSGNTTSAAPAPAPSTAPTPQSQAAAFAAAGTQILTGQGGPQVGTASDLSGITLPPFAPSPWTGTPGDHSIPTCPAPPTES